jgi:GntR family transcriptional regulator, transcriptional repressor for pyruvate dehydrogenase complex
LDFREHTTADSAAPDGVLFRQLGRRKAYEEVADQMRERIFAATVKTGDRLPTERDLAMQFGVSRVVVREAVRVLELSGLLTVKKGPKGGIFVAGDHQRPITDSIGNLLACGEARLKDLFEVRMLIEPYAAARVARIGTAKDFALLAAMIEHADAEHGRGAGIRDLNIELHRHIIRMSRNPVLAAVGETVLMMLADRLKPVEGHAPSGVVLRLHKKMLEAFRRRDAAAARSFMEKDITSVGKRYALLDAKTHSPRRKE